MQVMELRQNQRRKLHYRWASLFQIHKPKAFSPWCPESSPADPRARAATLYSAYPSVSISAKQVIHGGLGDVSYVRVSLCASLPQSAGAQPHSCCNCIWGNNTCHKVISSFNFSPYMFHFEDAKGMLINVYHETCLLDKSWRCRGEFFHQKFTVIIATAIIRYVQLTLEIPVIVSKKRVFSFHFCFFFNCTNSNTAGCRNSRYRNHALFPSSILK